MRLTTSRWIWWKWTPRYATCPVWLCTSGFRKASAVRFGCVLRSGFIILDHDWNIFYIWPRHGRTQHLHHPPGRLDQPPVWEPAQVWQLTAFEELTSACGLLGTHFWVHLSLWFLELKKLICLFLRTSLTSFLRGRLCPRNLSAPEDHDFLLRRYLVCWIWIICRLNRPLLQNEPSCHNNFSQLCWSILLQLQRMIHAKTVRCYNDAYDIMIHKYIIYEYI